MEESSLEDSLMDPVCIDDVIFYGRITPYEEKVRLQFEKRLKEKRARTKCLMSDPCSFKNHATPRFESSGYDEAANETVNQSSMFESFSLEETKFESFNDSLDDEKKETVEKINAVQFLSDQVRVGSRKPATKQKRRVSSLCDSLEDIHSLVSTVDKFSLSEEIEGVIFETNAYDDSLKNDDPLEKENLISNDQYFDDDSLAILELEKTFDDSLEDNIIFPLTQIDNRSTCVKISEELDSIEEKLPVKSSLDSSIAIIYENVVSTLDEVGVTIEGVKSEFPSTSEEVISKDSLEEGADILHKVIDNTSLFPPDDPKSTSSSISVYLSASEDLDAIDQNSSNKFSGNIAQSLNSKKVDSPKNVLDSASKVNKNSRDSGLKFCPSKSVCVKDTSPSKVDAIARHEDKSQDCCKSAVITVKMDETILIDESILVPDISDNDSVEKEKSKSPLHSKRSNFDCHPNDTICIDDSFILPNIKPEKSASDSSEEDYFDVSNEVEILKNPVKNPSDPSAIAISKMEEVVKDYIKKQYLKENVGSVIENDHSCPILKADAKLKFQFELAFDEKQGINILSISPLKSRVEKKQVSPGKADSKKEASGLPTSKRPISKPRHSSECSSRKGKSPIGDTTPSKQKYKTRKSGSPKKIDCDTQINAEISSVSNENQVVNTSKELHHFSKPASSKRIVEKQTKSKESSNVKKVRKSTPDGATSNQQNPERSSYVASSTNDCSSKNRQDGWNDKLLQALDLHDTSSVSDVSFIQSRDSIMPLNLCLRDRTVGAYLGEVDSKENIPCIVVPGFIRESPFKAKRKSSPKSKNDTPRSKLDFDLGKSEGKVNSATKIPIRKMDSRLPVPVSQKIPKKDSKVPATFKFPLIKPVTPTEITPCPEKADEAGKKGHHFCTVRNSVSRVPQSASKLTTKKFKNIQSPVAKYIGKLHVNTPLKTTHRFDGNALFATPIPMGKVTPKRSEDEFVNSAQNSPNLRPFKKA